MFAFASQYVSPMTLVCQEQAAQRRTRPEPCRYTPEPKRRSVRKIQTEE
jgi:hypothetical protein